MLGLLHISLRWSLRWSRFLVILFLTLALMPGVFEVIENGSHLIREGHWAHAEGGGDHHDPASPEHGCTPTLHLCGCHASLVFLVMEFPAPPVLRVQGGQSSAPPVSTLARFDPRLDRPPQA